MKKMGILLTTDRHASWALQLARSARAQSVTVRIHLTGSAVCIACTAAIKDLLKVADVTLCRRSANTFLQPDQRAACDPRLFASPDRMAALIAECERCIAF